MSTEQLVSLTHGEGGVVTMNLAAPGKPSVLTQDSGKAMQQALAEVAASPKARVLVLRSLGKSFCAGGDIAAISACFEDSDRLLGAIIDAFHGAILALRRLPIPVIGSVHGAAAGGGFSLALACDLLVMASSARFVVAYPALGTSSDGGLSHFLAQRIGAAKALELVLGSGTVSANDAQTLGLAAKVVPDERLEAETMAYASHIAQLPPQSVHEFKRLFSGMEDVGLYAQLQREKEAFLRCAQTAEFRDRVSSFLHKRT
jgi:2-(1,2-epoxy-1,2-dihydrophenyl)acetyl-CoA isomerase